MHIPGAHPLERGREERDSGRHLRGLWGVRPKWLEGGRFPLEDSAERRRGRGNDRTIIAAIVSASLVAAVPPSFAGSVAGFGGSTEITQLANNIELVNSYLQQVQSYATQLQQYQNMIQNTLNIPAQVWGAIEGDLMGVAGVVQQGQALAYSATNIASQFENTFKGFTFTGPAKLVNDGVGTGSDGCEAFTGFAGRAAKPVLVRARQLLTTLESGHSLTEKTEMPELPLFAAASVVAPESLAARELAERLAGIDIDGLTPRDALNLMAELKAMLG